MREALTIVGLALIGLPVAFWCLGKFFMWLGKKW